MKNEPHNSKTIEDYFAPPDVHELERERAGGGVATLLISLVVLVVEYFLLRYALPNHPFALVFHLLIVAALGFVAYTLPIDNRETRFVLLLLIAISVAG